MLAGLRRRLKDNATKTRGVCDMTVLDQFRLDGKCILITGGSRGFGRAIALATAEAGADVMLVARDPDSLARTADEVRDRGRKVWTFARMCRPGSLRGPLSEGARRRASEDY